MTQFRLDVVQIFLRLNTDPYVFVQKNKIMSTIMLIKPETRFEKEVVFREMYILYTIIQNQ